MPRITRPQVYRVVREMLPREQFGPEELLLWLEETQLRNERARRSHQRRRAARHTRRLGHHPKPVVVVLEVWPESHWPGFALRQADVIQSYTAW